MDPKDVQLARLKRNLRVLADAAHQRSGFENPSVANGEGGVGFVSSPVVDADITASVTGCLPIHQSGDKAAYPVKTADNHKNSAKPKAAVVAWDLSHNPVGRAYVIYQLLEQDWDVELVGPIWNRYGSDIWKPLQNAGLKIRSFGCTTIADFIPKAELMVAASDYDLVVVCKPRLPSIYLGALIRQKCNCKMVLDIDDHELSFFSNEQPASLDQLEMALAANPELDQFELYEETGTRVAQSLIGEFDQLIVSNVALQNKFGGHIIRHARDEKRFFPEPSIREDARKHLGISENEFALVFIGTPREHKGIFRVAKALHELQDPEIVFHIVGTISDSRIRKRLDTFTDANIVLHDDCAFSDLPFLLSAADLVPLIQEADHPIAQYQIPAKISDASALGIPILATRTPPVADLFSRGLLREVSESDLGEVIAEYKAQSPGAKSLLRNSFLGEFSLSVNRARLNLVIDQSKSSEMHDSPISEGSLDQMIIMIREAYRSKRVSAMVPNISTASNNNETRFRSKPGLSWLKNGIGMGSSKQTTAENTFDLVFFWKQNDSGMYGRRSDMMVKYLSQSPQVRRIIQFDAPIDKTQVDRLVAGQKSDKSDIDLQRLHDRTLNLIDTEKTRYRTFLGSGDHAYASYVKDEMQSFDMHPGNTIAWFCPVVWDTAELIDTLDFRGVVSDLIDDHRAWNNTIEMTARLDTAYSECLQRSDLVFSNCQSLADAFSSECRDIHVVPNGAERLSEFPETPMPDRLTGLPGPVIGYVGTLRDRIDWMLLDEIVGRRPDASFVFIGPGDDTPQAKQLDDYHNVHMLGPIAYHDVLPYLRSFDVAIIPHIRNRLTERMNPLKLYNYFAAGLPVVTTDINNIDDLTNQIQVAHSADEFDEALTRSTTMKRDTRDAAWRESMNKIAWDTRVEEVLGLMNAHFNSEYSDKVKRAVAS